MKPTKEEILKKHLEYGNPTSIQNHVEFENYIFKEHILKAMTEYAREACGEQDKTWKSLIDYYLDNESIITKEDAKKLIFRAQLLNKLPEGL
jgi:hypothetical protein